MLFHVAPVAARASIAVEGLTVQGAEWYEEQTPGVYAWTDEAAARRCRNEYERIGEGPFDIWTFPASGWPDDPLCPGGVFSTEPVPPALLSLHSPADWAEGD
jgi:hypothetical protein